MCRIEERVYINADGNRSKFEDTYPCSKSRNGRLCAKVNRRTTEYYPKKGPITRNDTPSPINPPTPVGTGTYLVQQRRPSSSGARPSTRDGPKAIKPEIIIEFGSKNDKNKVSVSAKTYKRSLATSSVDDVAVESPGSDASHTIRTGFPEAPIPPQASVYGHTDDYSTTPTLHHGYHHHRHTSSTSSYTGSSRTPSLYVTSDPDYDSPTSTRNTRLPPAIHNPSATGASSSPSRPHIHGGNSAAVYNTTLVTPHFSQESHTPDGLFAMDNLDFADRSASSHASSAASSQSRRGKDHDQSRKKKAEERKRQEDLEDKLTKDDNIKQVRFELGRAEGRAKERAENLTAEKEKQRAKDREEARRRADQEREKEAAKERKKEKEKSKMPPSNSSSKRPAASRRSSVSMTPAQVEEQRRLLAADLGHMQGESRAAEAREREESMALLIQQQQDTSYYNPRTGPVPSNAPTLTRRDSHSRRNSVSADARPALGRSNSNRRTSVVQSNPPPISAHGTASYTRPPSARTHAPPPVSFPSNFNTRPHSTRRSSITQENPFAAPPTRGSNSSIENPFAPAPSVHSPPVTIHQDPWDARCMRDALPITKTISDDRHASQRRGGDANHGFGSHSAAREATRAMGRFAGHDVDFVTDSEDEITHGHGRRRY